MTHSQIVTKWGWDFGLSEAISHPASLQGARWDQFISPLPAQDLFGSTSSIPIENHFVLRLSTRDRQSLGNHLIQ